MDKISTGRNEMEGYPKCMKMPQSCHWNTVVVADVAYIL